MSGCCFKGLKAEKRLSSEVAEKDLLKWDTMSMLFTGRTMGANKLLNVYDQKFQEFIIMNTTSLCSRY